MKFRHVVVERHRRPQRQVVVRHPLRVDLQAAEHRQQRRPAGHRAVAS